MVTSSFQAITPPSQVAAQAEIIRLQTLSLLDQLTETAPVLDLPELPQVLHDYRRKLHDNTYQVLVLGEAKRGKSTFVNALIGRDLLPTDVAIATNQVFRVRHAEREGYRLRFANGSAQEVRADDLPRYGSQVVEDTEGVPCLSRQLLWIEVDVPLRFLAPNVSLLDTPGMGGLYAAHAEITNRFVPEADAVIFVLSSQRPVGQSDLDFLRQILRVTSNVFFIQTMIDLYSEEDWQVVRRRSEQLLTERFGDQLADPRVWPISSTNLRVAAEIGDEDLLRVSRHGDFDAALRAFLFRVTGWARSAEAVLVAGHYHAQCRGNLQTRQAAVSSPSLRQWADLPQELERRRKEFATDWGLNGSKRRQLHAAVKQAGAAAQLMFRRTLDINGDIEQAQRKRIDQLISFEQALALAKTLGADVAAEANNRWHQAGQQVLARCCQLLGPFLEAVEALNLLPELGTVAPAVPAGFTLKSQDDWWPRLLRGHKEGVAGIAMGGSVASMAATVLAAHLVGPLAILGAIIFGIMGLGRGLYSFTKKQLEAARGELQEHLARTLNAFRVFCFTGPQDDQLSPVGHFFANLENRVTRETDDAVVRKLAELTAQIAQLQEDARLDAEQRRERAEQLERQLAKWQHLSEALERLVVELNGFGPEVFGSHHN